MDRTQNIHTFTSNEKNVRTHRLFCGGRWSLCAPLPARMLVGWMSWNPRFRRMNVKGLFFLVDQSFYG